MIKTLIIGCGNIAGRFDEGRGLHAPPLSHAGAFRAHGGYELLACIDPDAERRAAFAAAWDVARAAASLDELGAAACEFDVVSICSPTTWHAAHLETALALRPRLVFAEKPLTDNAADSALWVERFADAGVGLAVNHTRRWAPDVVQLASELRAGAYGAIRSISAVYSKGVTNNGSHMLDLIAMLAGPLRLVAAGPPRFDHWPNDPSVPALLTAGEDVTVSLNIGDAADYSLFELELVTARGAIAMEDGGLRWTVRAAGESSAFAGYRALGMPEQRPGRYFEAMACAAENIANWLNGNGALACDGTTALEAQKLSESIRLSARPGGHPPAAAMPN